MLIKIFDLFKKLFDGGEAKLELIKSEDPLNRNRDLYRPPGKNYPLSFYQAVKKPNSYFSHIFYILN